jgi:hypothetical protein
MATDNVIGFQNKEDIISQYNAPADALKGAHIYLAWYGYGSYCGCSLVVFKKDGKLWEVNGSHCSCYGLEDQWRPEETSWEALAMRTFGDDYDGNVEATQALQRLVKRYLKKEKP